MSTPANKLFGWANRYARGLSGLSRIVSATITPQELQNSVQPTVPIQEMWGCDTLRIVSATFSPLVSVDTTTAAGFLAPIRGVTWIVCSASVQVDLIEGDTLEYVQLRLTAPRGLTTLGGAGQQAAGIAERWWIPGHTGVLGAAGEALSASVLFPRGLVMTGDGISGFSARCGGFASGAAGSSSLQVRACVYELETPNG